MMSAGRLRLMMTGSELLELPPPPWLATKSSSVSAKAAVVLGVKVLPLPVAAWSPNGIIVKVVPFQTGAELVARPMSSIIWLAAVLSEYEAEISRLLARQ